MEFHFSPEHQRRFIDMGVRKVLLSPEQNTLVTSDPLTARTLHQYLLPESLTRLESLQARFAMSDRLTNPQHQWLESGGDLKYMEHQIPVIEAALAQPATLVADPAGSGKTAIAIGIMNNNWLPRTLIVCPATVRRMWEAYIKKWYVGDSDNTYVVTQGKAEIPESASVVIVNYDLFYRPNIMTQLVAQGFDCVVYDECQAFANPAAKRSRAFAVHHNLLVNNLQANGSQIFMSATPAMSRPIQLWRLLSIAAPETIAPHKNYYSYGEYFCSGFKQGKDWVMTGASNKPELQFRLRSTFMMRREKSTILPFLPKKLPPIIMPVGAKEDTEEIQALQQETFGAEFKFTDVSLSDMGVRYRGQGAEARKAYMAAMSKLRREIGEHKLEIGTQLIKDLLLNPDQKIVIFAVHKAIVASLKKSLGKFNPVIIDGDTPVDTRHAVEQQFQSDPECRVFIGNLRAASVGITLTAASKVFFFELPWTAGEYEQAEERIHRIGQTKETQAYLLVLRHTIDEYVAQGLLNKQHTLSQIFNA